MAAADESCKKSEAREPFTPSPYPGKEEEGDGIGEDRASNQKDDVPAPGDQTEEDGVSRHPGPGKKIRSTVQAHCP